MRLINYWWWIKRRRAKHTPAASAYATRVLALGPVTYYQLNGDATDSSGNGYDGTSTGATAGAAGIGDGQTAYSFDGTGDYINIAPMAGAFDGDEGSILVWGKTAAWADGILRYAANIKNGDGTNHIALIKWTTANTFVFQRTDSDSVQSVSIPLSTTAYFCAVLTWSVALDALKAYVGGVQVGVTRTGLTNAGDAPAAATMAIGAIGTTGANSWGGSLAHVAIWDRALSGAEVLSLGPTGEGLQTEGGDFLTTETPDYLIQE